MSDYQLRFAGIARLYGVSALETFKAAHVCVVGIGGVGSWAAEALARSGIGTITLIDLDDVCISNINRQLHALTDTIGQDKVAVMAARIKAINPDCVVHQIEDFVTTENLQSLINKEMDYVVDAIDSIKAKTCVTAFVVTTTTAVIRNVVLALTVCFQPSNWFIPSRMAVSVSKKQHKLTIVVK